MPTAASGTYAGRPRCEPNWPALAAMARARFVAQNQRVQPERAGPRAGVRARRRRRARPLRDGRFHVGARCACPGWLGGGSGSTLPAGVDARAVTPLVVVGLPREGTCRPAGRAARAGAPPHRQPGARVHSLTVNTHGPIAQRTPGPLCAVAGRPLPAGGRRRRARRGAAGRTQARHRRRSSAITPETLSRLMRSLTHTGIINVADYTVHVPTSTRCGAWPDNRLSLGPGRLAAYPTGAVLRDRQSRILRRAFHRCSPDAPAATGSNGGSPRGAGGTDPCGA